MGNAQTFIDLREDPGWATLRPRRAVTRSPARSWSRVGETSPGWLSQTPRTVAEAVGIPTRTINGAGHSPHLAHRRAAAIIEEFAG